MRLRPPFALVAMLILIVFAASGCGDSKSNTGTATPAGATQSTDTGSTSASGSTGAAASQAYMACIDAANKLPDTTQAFEAKQRCKTAYESIKDAAANIKKNTAAARANCEQAANRIPNSAAKANALEACAKIQ